MQYVKIKEVIVEQIESGMLQPNQKLPSERKLAESFDTTRITLREALSVLEAEGKIFREDRRGWFIAPIPLAYNPANADSFARIAEKQSKVARSELILAKSMLASKEAAKLLQLPPFTDVYRIEKVRYLDDRPVAHVTQFIRSELFPSLLDFDLNEPVSKVYEEAYGVKRSSVNYKMSTSSLFDTQATMLRATSGAPSIIVEKVFRDKNGHIIECDVESWRHDAITVHGSANLIAESGA